MRSSWGRKKSFRGDATQIGGELNLLHLIYGGLDHLSVTFQLHMLAEARGVLALLPAAIRARTAVDYRLLGGADDDGTTDWDIYPADEVPFLIRRKQLRTFLAECGLDAAAMIAHAKQRRASPPVHGVASNTSAEGDQGTFAPSQTLAGSPRSDISTPRKGRSGRGEGPMSETMALFGTSAGKTMTPRSGGGGFGPHQTAMIDNTFSFGSTVRACGVLGETLRPAMTGVQPFLSETAASSPNNLFAMSGSYNNFFFSNIGDEDDEDPEDDLEYLACDEAREVAMESIALDHIGRDLFVYVISRALYRARTHLPDGTVSLSGCRELAAESFRSMERHGQESHCSWSDLSELLLEETSLRYNAVSFQKTSSEVFDRYVMKHSPAVPIDAVKVIPVQNSGFVLFDLQSRNAHHPNRISLCCDHDFSERHYIQRVDDADMGEIIASVWLGQRTYHTPVLFVSGTDMCIHGFDVGPMAVRKLLLRTHVIRSQTSIHVLRMLEQDKLVCGHRDGVLAVYNIRSMLREPGIDAKGKLRITSDGTILDEEHVHRLARERQKAYDSLMGRAASHLAVDLCDAVMGELKAHSHVITGIVVVSAASLATAALDGYVCVIHINTWSITKKFLAESCGLTGLDYSSAYGSLVTRSFDSAVKVWSGFSGANPITLHDIAHPHQRQIVSMAILDDNPHVLTMDGDGFVKTWDLRSTACLHTSLVTEPRAYRDHNALLSSILYQPKYRRIVAVRRYHHLHSVSQFVPGSAFLKAHTDAVKFLTVTHNTGIIVSGTLGELKWWDAARGGLRHGVTVEDNTTNNNGTTTTGTSGRAQSPDRSNSPTGGKRGGPRGGTTSTTSTSVSNDVCAMCVDFDGNKVAYATNGALIHEHRLASGRKTRTLQLFSPMYDIVMPRPDTLHAVGLTYCKGTRELLAVCVNGTLRYFSQAGDALYPTRVTNIFSEMELRSARVAAAAAARLHHTAAMTTGIISGTNASKGEMVPFQQTTATSRKASASASNSYRTQNPSTTTTGGEKRHCDTGKCVSDDPIEEDSGNTKHVGIDPVQHCAFSNGLQLLVVVTASGRIRVIRMASPTGAYTHEFSLPLSYSHAALTVHRQQSGTPPPQSPTTRAAAASTNTASGIPAVGSNGSDACPTLDVSAVCFLEPYPCLTVADTSGGITLFLVDPAPLLSIIDAAAIADNLYYHSHFYTVSDSALQNVFHDDDSPLKKNRGGLVGTMPSSRLKGSRRWSLAPLLDIHPPPASTTTQQNTLHSATDTSAAISAVLMASDRLPSLYKWATRFACDRSYATQLTFDHRTACLYLCCNDGSLMAYQMLKFLFAFHLTPLWGPDSIPVFTEMNRQLRHAARSARNSTAAAAGNIPLHVASDQSSDCDHEDGETTPEFTSLVDNGPSRRPSHGEKVENPSATTRKGRPSTIAVMSKAGGAAGSPPSDVFTPQRKRHTAATTTTGTTSSLNQQKTTLHHQRPQSDKHSAVVVSEFNWDSSTSNHDQPQQEQVFALTQPTGTAGRGGVVTNGSSSTGGADAFCPFPHLSVSGEAFIGEQQVAGEDDDHCQEDQKNGSVSVLAAGRNASKTFSRHKRGNSRQDRDSIVHTHSSSRVAKSASPLVGGTLSQLLSASAAFAVENHREAVSNGLDLHTIEANTGKLAAPRHSINGIATELRQSELARRVTVPEHCLTLASDLQGYLRAHARELLTSVEPTSWGAGIASSGSSHGAARSSHTCTSNEKNRNGTTEQLYFYDDADMVDRELVTLVRRRRCGDVVTPPEALFKAIANAMPATTTTATNSNSHGGSSKTPLKAGGGEAAAATATQGTGSMPAAIVTLANSFVAVADQDGGVSLWLPELSDKLTEVNCGAVYIPLIRDLISQAMTAFKAARGGADVDPIKKRELDFEAKLLLRRLGGACAGAGGQGDDQRTAELPHLGLADTYRDELWKATLEDRNEFEKGEDRSDLFCGGGRHNNKSISDMKSSRSTTTKGSSNTTPKKKNKSGTRGLDFTEPSPVGHPPASPMPRGFARSFLNSSFGDITARADRQQPPQPHTPHHQGPAAPVAAVKGTNISNRIGGAATVESTTPSRTHRERSVGIIAPPPAATATDSHGAFGSHRTSVDSAAATTDLFEEEEENEEERNSGGNPFDVNNWHYSSGGDTSHEGEEDVTDADVEEGNLTNIGRPTSTAFRVVRRSAPVHKKKKKDDDDEKPQTCPPLFSTPRTMGKHGTTTASTNTTSSSNHKKRSIFNVSSPSSATSAMTGSPTSIKRARPPHTVRMPPAAIAPPLPPPLSPSSHCTSNGKNRNIQEESGGISSAHGGSVAVDVLITNSPSTSLFANYPKARSQHTGTTRTSENIHSASAANHSTLSVHSPVPPPPRTRRALDEGAIPALARRQLDAATLKSLASPSRGPSSSASSSAALVGGGSGTSPSDSSRLLALSLASSTSPRNHHRQRSSAANSGGVAAAFGFVLPKRPSSGR